MREAAGERFSRRGPTCDLASREDRSDNGRDAT
mgnify:CR=1 FL=1